MGQHLNRSADNLGTFLTQKVERRAKRRILFDRVVRMLVSPPFENKLAGDPEQKRPQRPATRIYASGLRHNARKHSCTMSSAPFADPVIRKTKR